MPKKLTQEEVVAQFEAIEKVKKRGYTFKNLIYVNNNTKVSVTCNVDDHGDFDILQSNFKKGNGCSKCSSRKKLTQKGVIVELEEIEREKQRGYTFQNVVYTHSNNDISITCNIDEHGDFLIMLSNFRKGFGCKKCSSIKRKLPTIFEQNKGIDKLKEYEKKKQKGYTFHNVVFVNDKTKVSITCPIQGHGDFLITPANFKNGGGCQKCFTEQQKFSQEKIISQFEEIEKIKQRGYTFNNVKYVQDKTKVSITCPVQGHGDFLMTPNNFKRGYGCQKCTNYGFKKDRPAIFYYSRYNKDGIELFKPGVTEYSVKNRYPKDFKYMTVLRTIEFETGKEAYDFEQSVLKDYDYARYTGPSLLKDGGNTELMTHDILGWDN